MGGNQVQSFDEWKRGGGPSTASVKTQSGDNVQSFGEWKRQQAIPIDSTSLVDHQFINSFLIEADDYLKRETQNYNALNYGAAVSRQGQDTRSKSWGNLYGRANTIKAHLLTNKDIYDPDGYEELLKTVNAFITNGNSLNDAFENAYQYYGQFENENDYNWYQKYQGNDSDSLLKMMDDLEDGDEKSWLQAYTTNVYNNELKDLDINAARAKVAGMEELLNTYRTNSRMVSDVNGQAWWEELRPKLLEYGGVEGLERAISRENQRIQLATRMQENIRNQSRFAGVEFRPDFAEKSVFDPANTEIGYRYINGDAWDRFLLEDQYGQYAEEFGYHAYDSLTDEEKAVYNYFMNTGDRESAADYLRHIQDPINQRKAQAVFEDGFKGHAGREFVYGWDAGLDQFRSGAEGFGAMIRGDTAQSTPSATQYASAMMREDLGENGKKLPEWLGGGTIGQAVYDSVTTTANMAPSILASTVIGLINPTAGAWVGSAMMGASAAGSAYQEMIDSGYSVSQARTYGSLVGAAELVLDKILGGITKLGSGSSLASAITRWAGNVDNALINLVGRIGGNALSEGAEEALQEVFSGWLQSEVTKENFYAKPADVIYSGLLGAVTGALFESPDAGMDVYQRTSQGQNVIRSGGVQTLTDMGKASGNTDIRRMAERTARKPSAYNVGGLSRQVSSNIHSQNVADISKQLAGNGMKGKAADQMAEVIASVLENGSESDIRLLASETDPIVAKTMRQVQMKGTALSQRMQQLRGATGKSHSITQVAAAYGIQSEAVKQVYKMGEDATGKNMPVDEFEYGFQRVFNIGKEGGKFEALTEEIAPGLNPQQRQAAYNIGRDAAAREKAEFARKAGAESSGVHILNEDGSVGDAVRIAEIASMDGKTVTYKLSDGRTVSEDQLSFSGDNAVLDTVKGLKLDVETANTMIRGSSTINKADSLIAQGIEDAYRYGSHGYSMERLLKDSEAAGILTEEMRQAAYDAGKNKPAKAKPSKAKPKTRGTKPGVYFDNGNGQVQAYDLKSTRQLKDTQKAGVQTAVVLQRLGIGTDFYFFESYVKDGKRVYRDEKGVERLAPNGWYDPNDGSIHIDLNAGNSGQGLTLYTMAHELTHFIEQWSQDKYKVLADFLIKNYEKGRSVDDLVHLKQEALSEGRNNPVSYDEAYSEVIADSMEAMLSDGNVLEKLAELKQRDEGLVRKMKAFFDNFVKKIRSIYAELIPESAEGQLVQEMKEQFEQLQQLFAEALADAGKNYRIASSEVMHSEKQIQYQSRNANTDKTSAAGIEYDPTLQDWEVETALFDALDHADSRNDNLIRVGKMPNYISQITGINGDFYIYRNHAYENMVSEEQAVKDGRPITRKRRKVDFHNLGFDRMEQAVLSLESPLVTMAVNNPEGNPTLSMVLPVTDDLGDPLYAIMSFYANRDINGSFIHKPHVLLTISNRPLLTERGSGRLSTIEAIEKAIENGSILDFDKKIRANLPVITQLTRLGNVTESTLKGNISRFQNDVKVFKEEKNIRYQDRPTAPITNRTLLANALESTTQDETELTRLREYRMSIDYLNEQEAKLTELRSQIREISFGKGPRDTARLKQLQEEATKTANRINVVDKKLLRLESAAPLRRVLEREKKKAIETTNAENAAALKRYKDETASAYNSQKSDIRIMEREFVRLMRDYERTTAEAKKNADKRQNAYEKDIALLEKEFVRLMKYHETEVKKVRRETNAFWEREFRQLLREYDTAGRNIKRLEAKIKAQRDSARKNVDSRGRTVLRNKIRKDIRELNQFLNHGNKKRNVKQGMQDFVSQAIAFGEILFADQPSDIELIKNGIGTDTTREERRLIIDVTEYLNQLPEQESNPNMSSIIQETNEWLTDALKQLKPVLERERVRLNRIPADSALGSLLDAYRSLRESKYSYISMAFKQEVLEYLEAIRTNFTGTLVKDMSQEQLLTLHKAYKMVLSTIRNANKAFVDGRSIEAEAKQMVGEMQAVKVPDGKIAVALRNLNNSIGWNYEKLYYALDRINSPTLTRLFGKLAESENITMQDVREAKAFQMEMIEKYHYNDWDVEKRMDHVFMDNTGRKFRLTLGQVMSLYAYSRRENTDKHLEYGGFKIGKAALTDAAPATTYKLTPDQVKAVTNILTPEQRLFAEAMQKYLSETMGAKGNEVSMKLYGIEMFGEENYFPLHIAGEYKARAQESQAKEQAGFQSMSNAGFTKARNQNATAPIVLEDFMDVWVDHVNEMSRYHGAVPALEDIRRVMNYSVYSDSTNDSVSVHAAMENAFGKKAVEYFDNLYREANSGAIADKMEAVPKKLLSLFRKNAVAYSLSVVIQQPASIYRARSLVDRKYFGVHGLFTITRGTLRILNRKKWNAAYNEMLKYAPGVTMTKEIGGFDTSTGSSIRSYLLDTEKGFFQSMKYDTLAKKAGTVLGVVDDNIIANLPEVADKIAWIEMWEAVKRETVSKNRKLTPGSDEFFKIVGRRFTEVVQATQVYDSMFSKSPMLKSRNLLIQSMVSFMNEPNTVANMAEAAIRNLCRGNVTKALNVAAALTASIVVTNALKSLIYAMRDDDEEETFIEKYISAISGNLISDATLFSYIPFIRDAWSAFQGYNVERADMAIIADAANAIIALSQLANKDVTGMDEDELEEWDRDCIEAKWRVAETLSPLFGIPLKNIRQEVMAIINTVNIYQLDKNRTATDLSIRHIIQDAVLTNRVNSGKSRSDKLYEAIIGGDTAYVDRLRATYKTEDSYHAAVRKALREHDSRIQQAANAYADGDFLEYDRLKTEIAGEGKFDYLDVDSAIKAEIRELEGDSDTTTEKKQPPRFTAEEYYVSLRDGNKNAADTIYDYLYQSEIDQGYLRHQAASNVQSQLASQVKKAYMNGEIPRNDAIKMLQDYAGKGETDVKQWDFELDTGYAWGARARGYYLGDISEKKLVDAVMDIEDASYEEAMEYMDFLDLAKGNEDVAITAAQARAYFEHAEPAGIQIEVWLDYKSRTSGIKNDLDEDGKPISYSAMKKKMEIINSLPISSEQKTAIAVSEDWTERNIRKYKLW